jgi:hypothetical protein
LRHGFLGFLEKSFFQIGVWKVFDGIYYMVKNSQPSDLIFITGSPQVGARKDFIRIIKTEAKQIPKKAKGVIMIDSSWSFANFQANTSVARQVLKEYSFDNIVAIIIWDRHQWSKCQHKTTFRKNLPND